MIRKIAVLFMLFNIVSCSEDKGTSIKSGDSSETSGDINFPDSKLDYPDNWPSSFDLGLPATEEDILAWDIDVRPDGKGLPKGMGTVSQGSIIYKNKCAVCHGTTGNEGPYDRLVGREPREGFPFGRNVNTLGLRTIGSYWPYATTIFDYIRRSMPQDQPGSLTDEEVYALTAYLLYKNEIIEEDEFMDANTLPQVIMPARDRFVLDNRIGGNEIR